MSGHSLHIGLNYIDSNHYGSYGRLEGCENDARDMKQVADLGGFNSSVLLNGDASVSNVRDEIRKAANSLASGDIFFVSYSGHGGQVTDTNGEETDSKDETWCLFDRQLVDDELYSLWSEFKAGVRIFVLSDSCHSGTVTKVLEFEKVKGDHSKDASAPGFRTLPKGILEETYRRNKDIYDRVQVENPRGNRAMVDASVLLISGCQDWQLSADGAANGFFTETLEAVWDNGAFAGSYLEFHAEIWNKMPNYQKPNYFKAGAPNPDFENQRPFQI